MVFQLFSCWQAIRDFCPEILNLPVAITCLVSPCWGAWITQNSLNLQIIRHLIRINFSRMWDVLGGCWYEAHRIGRRFVTILFLCCLSLRVSFIFTLCTVLCYLRKGLHSHTLTSWGQEILLSLQYPVRKTLGKFPGGAVDKNSPGNAGDMGSIPVQEDSTGHRATKCMQHSYWSLHAPAPESHNSWSWSS